MKFKDALNIISNNNISSLLLQGSFGLEKENQRVTKDGNLAMTAHPAVFGDKLTNKYVTTDFAESQVEMITPPLSTVEQAYNALLKTQQFVEHGIGSELLWPMSMPPILPNDADIPVSKFDGSAEGRKKEIYRKGLALRYGKKMQMISGIHYNFSFSDELLNVLKPHISPELNYKEYKDKLYLSIIRNFLRYRWLLVYLYGSSPNCDATYDSVVVNEINNVKMCCPDCCDAFGNFKHRATSMRVSRFGYSNSPEGKYDMYFNSIAEFSGILKEMVMTPEERYERLGLFNGDEQVQLNTNLLQNESEYYSSIRPKQITEPGESQLSAIAARGIQYIEVRILDINPYEIIGIDKSEMHFIHLFLIYCMIEDSPLITSEEFHKIKLNHNLTALSGRDESLKLYNYFSDGCKPLKAAGNDIFTKLYEIAKVLDSSNGRSVYSQVLDGELKKLKDITLLPSHRIYNEMKQNNMTFAEFGLAHARKYKAEIENIEVK